MKKTSTCFSLLAFVTAIGVVVFLCAGLAWLSSVCTFVTHSQFPPLTLPIGTRYWRFITAGLPGFLGVALGVAAVFKTGWRKNRLLCATLGVVLLQRLLEFHIVFVIVNSGFKQ